MSPLSKKDYPQDKPSQGPPPVYPNQAYHPQNPPYKPGQYQPQPQPQPQPQVIYVERRKDKDNDAGLCATACCLGLCASCCCPCWCCF